MFDRLSPTDETSAARCVRLPSLVAKRPGEPPLGLTLVADLRLTLVADLRLTLVADLRLTPVADLRLTPVADLQLTLVGDA